MVSGNINNIRNMDTLLDKLKNDTETYDHMVKISDICLDDVDHDSYINYYLHSVGFVPISAFDITVRMFIKSFEWFIKGILFERIKTKVTAFEETIDDTRSWNATQSGSDTNKENDDGKDWV